MFSGDGAGWIVPDGVVSIIRREFPTENDGWKSARGSQFLSLKPGMDPAGTERLRPRGFKFCEHTDIMLPWRLRTANFGKSCCVDQAEGRAFSTHFESDG